MPYDYAPPPKRAEDAAVADAQSEATGRDQVRTLAGYEAQQAALSPDAVQRHGGRSGQAQQAVHAAASAGIAGGGGRLPHAEQIQASFGAHDVSGISAHVGGAASDACGAMGAEAYATGSSVAFASAPSLHLAAHEAAHVVQQRQGVSLSGGVGQHGDSYEQQADAVADRVVAGQSAEDLLGPTGSASSGAVQTKAIQCYTVHEVKGQSVKLGEGKQTLWESTKGLYATQERIDEANAGLANAGKEGSFVAMVPGEAGYEVGGKDLLRVEPTWVKHAKPGYHKGAQEANEAGAADSEGTVTGKDTDDMAFWADCGRSSAAVMGSQGMDRRAVHGGQETSRGMLDSSVYYRASANAMANEIYMTRIPSFIADPANKAFLVEGVHKTGEALKTPSNIADAKRMYWELGAAGRDKFDKEAGINHYANPEIGEGYSMTTEREMPGFKETSKKTWNFHWAGVVMKDGSDNITMEAYAVTRETAKKAGLLRTSDYIDRDWRYYIYGGLDEKGNVKDESQTFHTAHLDSNTHGSHASSIRVRTKK